MAKFTPIDLNSGFQSTQALNNNFSLLETLSDTWLSRDGTTPNQMLADLDMNSNRVINALTVETTNLTVNGETLVVPSNPVTLPTDPQLYLDILQGKILLEFDTVADMVTASTLVIGDIVVTAGYTTKGDGGDNLYEIVAAGTGTDDGGSFIDLPNVLPSALQSKGLFPGSEITVKQFGATGDGATDDTAELQAAANYVGSFVDILSDPRRGGLRVFFPYGRYLISAPITWNFTSDGFTSTEIYGDSIMNGAQIEGTHAGNIFEWTHGEHAEIHHLSFYGAGCSALRQTTFGTGFYTSAFHFHHLEFNRNLNECFVGNLQFTTWEHCQFGRFGTPSAFHRHIFNDGETSASNLNTFRYCSFVGAANDYSTKITSGDNWLFEICRWENNNTPSLLLTGLAKVVLRGCWWENNAVTDQAATPWEIKTDDFGGIQLRVLKIEHCKIGVTAVHDHFIKSTTTGGLLNILVQHNSGSGFPVGYTFTDYDGVEDNGIVKWEFNAFVNHTHNNYDVGKFTNDAFVTRQGAAIANVTGDGTVYAATFNTVDSNRIGSLASSIHTATNTGAYRYSCTMSLGGILVGHTTATLNLVTTARTYTTDVNIGAIRTVGNTATISLDQVVIMTKDDTASITLTISGSTKDVDITNVSTIFSGERVVNS